MNSLYEISREYTEALEGLEIDEETGEILNYEALEKLDGQLEEKAESIACYIKDLTAHAEAVKAEGEILAKRRKAAENKAESLKRYLATCMDMAGKEKLETARCKIGFRRTSVVNILDESKIPAEYMNEKITYTPSKTAIGEAIKAGEAVPGASIEQKRSIQIK